MILPFVQFCRERKVRYCPASPFVVSAYVLWLMSMGVSGINKMLHAIEELHDLNGRANPVQTHVVKVVLGELVSKEPPGPPPRSWTKAEQLSWATLPSDVRSAIARREADREKELRRAQNAAAAKRKTGDAEKVAEPQHT
jgi:hypothetical protein